MHPKTRLQQLLCLWCVEGVPLEVEERIQVRKLYLLCVLLFLQAPSVAAMDTASTTSTTRQSSVQLAGFDELLLVTTLVCISAIAVWQGLKALWSDGFSEVAVQNDNWLDLNDCRGWLRELFRLKLTDWKENRAQSWPMDLEATLMDENQSILHRCRPGSEQWSQGLS